MSCRSRSQSAQAETPSPPDDDVSPPHGEFVISLQKAGQSATSTKRLSGVKFGGLTVQAPIPIVMATYNKGNPPRNPFPAVLTGSENSPLNIIGTITGIIDSIGGIIQTAPALLQSLHDESGGAVPETPLPNSGYLGEKSSKLVHFVRSKSLAAGVPWSTPITFGDLHEACGKLKTVLEGQLNSLQTSFRKGSAEISTSGAASFGMGPSIDGSKPISEGASCIPAMRSAIASATRIVPLKEAKFRAAIEDLKVPTWHTKQTQDSMKFAHESARQVLGADATTAPVNMIPARATETWNPDEHPGSWRYMLPLGIPEDAFSDPTIVAALGPYYKGTGWAGSVALDFLPSGFSAQGGQDGLVTSYNAIDSNGPYANPPLIAYTLVDNTIAPYTNYQLFYKVTSIEIMMSRFSKTPSDQYDPMASLPAGADAVSSCFDTGTGLPSGVGPFSGIEVKAAFATVILHVPEDGVAFDKENQWDPYTSGPGSGTRVISTRARVTTGPVIRYDSVNNSGIIWQVPAESGENKTALVTVKPSQVMSNDCTLQYDCWTRATLTFEHPINIPVFTPDTWAGKADSLASGSMTEATTINDPWDSDWKQFNDIGAKMPFLVPMRPTIVMHTPNNSMTTSADPSACSATFLPITINGTLGAVPVYEDHMPSAGTITAELPVSALGISGIRSVPEQWPKPPIVWGTAQACTSTAYSIGIPGNLPQPDTLTVEEYLNAVLASNLTMGDAMGCVSLFKSVGLDPQRSLVRKGTSIWKENSGALATTVDAAFTSILGSDPEHITDLCTSWTEIFAEFKTHILSLPTTGRFVPDTPFGGEIDPRLLLKKGEDYWTITPSVCRGLYYLNEFFNNTGRWAGFPLLLRRKACQHLMSTLKTLLFSVESSSAALAAWGLATGVNVE